MDSLALPGAGLPDVNNGPAILAAVATTTIIALVVVVLRLYVRIGMLRAIGPDDYFVISAMICSLSAFFVNIPDVALGAGRHAAYINPPSNISKGLKLNFVTQPFFLMGLPFVKASVAFFLFRIAPNKWYRHGLVAVTVFLLAISTFFFTTLFVQCKPLAAVWDFSLRATAKCWDPHLLRRFSYTNTSLNIITDLGFSVLPIPILWNVQMNKRMKASIVVIMGLGVFAAVASTVKLTYIRSYGLSGDFLFDSTGLTIWSATELNTGIIACSIPCLKPLFQFMLENTLYGSNGKMNGKTSTTTYAMQSTGQNIETGVDSDLERAEYSGGDGGVKLDTLERQVELKNDGRFPDDVSDETLLALEGPGIRKTTRISVSRETVESSS